jgi:mersacidin/lichenicidin family type 2 lantibiotic
MPKVDIVRAWKDEEYRLSLTDEQRAQLPNPAGSLDLEDMEICAVPVGKPTVTFPKCCHTY